MTGPKWTIMKREKKMLVQRNFEISRQEKDEEAAALLVYDHFL
jgi:hypothetical protein